MHIHESPFLFVLVVFLPWPLLFERVVTCDINLPVCRPVRRHVTPSLNIYHQDTLH